MEMCSLAPHIACVLKTMMIILLHVSCTSGTESYSMQMVPNAQCPGKVIASGHRYRTVGARSVLECAARCRPDDQCMSIVFEKDSSTCHLSNSTASEDCSNTVSAAKGWKYMERVKLVQQVQCDNGGIVNADGRTCTCPDGYYGNFCNIIVRGCEDLVDRDLSTGVYFIKPGMSAVHFPVHCSVLTSGLIRTMVASREDYTFNFNRTWQEYRDGFGDPDSSSYWIGLERLHQLTWDRQYELRFKVKLQNRTTLYQYYNYFMLGNESSWYPFSFKQPVLDRNLGNCLQDLLGAGFSTHDVDNDNSYVNCAQRHGAGWWFQGDNCSTCNPFGPIIQPFDGWRKGVEGEAFWFYKLGDLIPFNFAVYLVSA